ncbi:MAG: tRNA (adenosine(37)-N6)-threonylcarbamoyltransferase complex ATPase subunit type 1 TsaE, partial [Hyphomicrobiaceae bacterium]
ARALIRALLDDAEAEVPSPTFALVQPYETKRFPVFHYDFYRLTQVSQTAELGVEEAIASGVALVEWPERAPGLLPSARLDVALQTPARSDVRDIRFLAHGTFAGRLERLSELERVIGTTPGAEEWTEARARYLQGDASTRSYARLMLAAGTRILMDAPRQPDGPPIRDGKPYSRIAHLAEDMRSYVAVAQALRSGGLSAPQVYAHDPDAGVLLIEDLGDRVFTAEVAAGGSQAELWLTAVEVLVALRGLPLPQTGYRLPLYDRGALHIETDLLLDWYWPAVTDAVAPGDVRAEFHRLWAGVFDRLSALPTGWVLRDYHSPNLMWLPDRTGLARVGILDFQDALEGHAAYDPVSLLQDARVDVPADLEADLFDIYCTAAARTDASFDRGAFSFAYAALGAQRNTKILGIFARLAARDGKRAYLRHVPRIWRYLERDLHHADLQPLRAWYDRHLPDTLRTRFL